MLLRPSSQASGRSAARWPGATVAGAGPVHSIPRPPVVETISTIAFLVKLYRVASGRVPHVLGQAGRAGRCRRVRLRSRRHPDPRCIASPRRVSGFRASPGCRRPGGSTRCEVRAYGAQCTALTRSRCTADARTPLSGAKQPVSRAVTSCRAAEIQERNRRVNVPPCCHGQVEIRG
jgi:hypothetical protein